MEAAGCGREEVVALLLDQPNVNLEARNVDGRTALLWAAECGPLRMVQLLLQHGADPAVVDNSGWTVLSLAGRGLPRRLLLPGFVLHSFSSFPPSKLVRSIKIRIITSVLLLPKSKVWR